jgi:sugar phosphate isomerase/epimerase
MIPRRRWLLGALASALPVRADDPKSEFPTDPRQRIAIASWPFRKLLDPRNSTIRLLDFPKLVVDRFGVRGIELLDDHFPETGGSYLEKLREVMASTGVRVVNLAVGRLGGSFYDREVKRDVIEKARDWIDAAAALGAPGIRVHLAAGSGPPDFVAAASALKIVADYGEAKGVVVHLENDDPRSEEAFFLIKVINAAETPWLRALPDFCNSMLLEKGAEYNDQAVAALFEHAYAICHVKDSEQSHGKTFHVDLTKMIAIAKASGYRGYFSMEYDADGDPFEPTKRLVDATLKALA